MKKNIILKVVFVLLFMCNVCQIVAQNDIHQVDWHLHSSFQPVDLFKRKALSNYVALANYVLSKNTNHRFIMGRIILTDEALYDNIIPKSRPVGFPYWVHVLPSGYTNASYGGGVGSDSLTGATVCSKTQWSQIYDYDSLRDDSPELRDFWIQMHIFLHEFPHTFGVAIGEYYSNNLISDLTGMAPINDINIFNPLDSYWGRHLDFYRDPMTMFQYGNPLLSNPVTKSSVLYAVRYTDLTAIIMNAGYSVYRESPPLGDLSHIKIKVVLSNNQPAKSAKVYIYNKWSQLLIVDRLDKDGRYEFNWGNPGGVSTDNLRLIKIYDYPNREAEAVYTTIWEIQEELLVYNNPNYERVIKLKSASFL